MSFDVPAAAYSSFMGRWSEPLSALFVDLLAPAPGARALDVGCGPGALTAMLVDRLGPDAVAAADPSRSFVDAVAERLPGVDARQASAERLPFDDDGFDLVTAQLVVHFMSEPVAGLREMGRVARPGGKVAACVWDNAGGTGPLSLFWRAARSLDPDAHDESGTAGSRRGHLVELATEAGLQGASETVLTVRRRFADTQEWWEPFTFGVGPAGSYVAGLDASARERLRVRCAELLPSPPFELAASAWTMTARAPG